MPQMKIEKKFFLVRVTQFRHHLAARIDQKLDVAEFQTFKKNLFVLRDTRTAGGKDAIRRGGSDA